jgi:hypothetical protein
MIRRLSLLFSLLILGCCGYSVHALLPPHLKTIFVQPVENQTVKPNLEVRLTDLLIQGFAHDGSLRIADLKQANVVLQCKLDGYEKLPQTYGANQEITTWRVTLQAQVDAQDQVKSQPLWSGSVPVTVNYDAATETEDQGIERGLNKLSAEIVRRTLIAW